jgi:hypothetical protein
MIWVNLGLLRARTANGSRSIDTVGNSTGLQVKEAAIADWLSVVPIDQHHSLLLYSYLRSRDAQSKTPLQWKWRFWRGGTAKAAALLANRHMEL